MEEEFLDLVRHGSIKSVNDFININEIDNAILNHALWVSSSFGYEDKVLLLLKLGAKCNYALEEAVACNYINTVKILLKYNIKSKTALLIACEHGNVNIAKILLEHGITCKTVINKVTKKEYRTEILNLFK